MIREDNLYKKMLYKNELIKIENYLII